MSEKNLEEKTRAVYSAARMASVGLELAVSVLMGYFGGAWLDEKFGWAPWASIVGLIAGFGAGLRSMIRTAMAVSAESDDDG